MLGNERDALQGPTKPVHNPVEEKPIKKIPVRRPTVLDGELDVILLCSRVSKDVCHRRDEQGQDNIRIQEELGKIARIGAGGSSAIVVYPDCESVSANLFERNRSKHSTGVVVGS